ncbi:hypothetical protein jhhlp_008276 [Lomentospora prolificans]|uniref:Phosphoglycerate mutase n=1 Tax=Lomentospora prolificans TaxID=41688 RepID=A0A2N3MXK3_9PEZI|nr:hypothetical protein jhhlp_008276 [Lomentospora prolificans]
MSDAEAATPRIFIVRHGETEWAKTGRHTGRTDIELTPRGIRQIIATANQMIGPGKVLDPARLMHVFVSPRKRARQTFDHLFEGKGGSASIPAEKVTVTESIAEWDYGDYEGLQAAEVRALRKAKGLDAQGDWNVWRDGCEGGESPDDVAERLDKLVTRIKDMQRPFMRGEKHADILLVAHGLILRVFVKRWLGYAVDAPMPMMMEPGAIGVLTYKHNNVEEPAFQVGLALPCVE